MTVKNQPCQTTLSSLSTTSSIPSSSTLFSLVLLQISAAFFTENYKKSLNSFLQIRSVVSISNFQYIGIKISIVAPILKVIIVLTLKFQSFGLQTSKAVSTKNLAKFSSFLLAFSLSN